MKTGRIMSAAAIACVVTALVCTGCGGGAGARGGGGGLARYELQVENATGRDLEDVDTRLDYGKGYASDPAAPMYGSLAPGARKGYNDDPKPVPERALVSWRVAGGAAGRREISAVRERAGPGFRGGIRFTINPDGSVTLTLHPRATR